TQCRAIQSLLLRGGGLSVCPPRPLRPRGSSRPLPRAAPRAPPAGRSPGRAPRRPPPGAGAPRRLAPRRAAVRVHARVRRGEGVLAGMVTDGDLRRAILRGVPLDGVVADIMNPAPVTASPGLGRAAAVELMLARAIRHLPLVDTGRRLVDVLFLEEQIAAPPLP